MTTPELTLQVSLLRQMIGDTELTDAELELYVLDATVDGVLSLDVAAARVWREKAAKLAGLTDVSESGSTRALSKLYKNALDMAAMYEGRNTATVVSLSGRTRTRAIRRAE